MAGEIAALFAVLAYQAWVTRSVARFPLYSRGQKAAQMLLVWLVPVVGALAVHLVMYGFSTEPMSRS